jgi:DNA polymerase-3 subunit gamma/tau
MAAYQSLYRRYRPQRFDEVLGQDHVIKALRNAVREGRVGHAYLFSGPRGTGKTSTARILAKVLNCEAPVDGEPCGKCENCVTVAEGRITDWLLEQDAASKSKVDDMRDLIERVPLGTSGKRRVIILDEVHMLSQGAENALLKTLEEPPEHVVFVLATTDPQKVRPTIRSRTQHFEFRLLSPDVLADHVRHVISDAGLGLDAEAVDRAVDHVIRSGAGSARDTLSALDQVAALGEVFDESEPVDAVLDALCDRDAGAVLVAVADALAAGRDPRTLGEDLIAALRDAFLAVMGAADEHVVPAQRERAARVGQRLGPAGLTRALDVLGESLIELARKPDPRIVVEVALVRLTQPATDRTLDAILERLDRLERGGGPGSGGGPAGGGGGSHEVSTSGGAAAAREALSNRRSSDASRSPEPAAEPTGDKPTLGAVVRQQEGRAGSADQAASDSTASVEGAARIPDLDEITDAWTGAVLIGLPKSVRSRWRGGRWIEPDPGTVRFAVSNEWHQKACDESRREVEEALVAHFGGPVPVAIVVEGEPAGGGASAVPGAALPDEVDHVDPDELQAADDAAVTGVDLVVRTFGGGELIQED